MRWRWIRTVVSLVLVAVTAATMSGCTSSKRPKYAYTGTWTKAPTRQVGPAGAAKDGGPAGQCFVHFKITNNSGHQIDGGSWDCGGIGTAIPPVASGDYWTADKTCETGHSCQCTSVLDLHVICTPKAGVPSIDEDGNEHCTVEYVIDAVNCH